MGVADVWPGGGCLALVGRAGQYTSHGHAVVELTVNVASWVNVDLTWLASRGDDLLAPLFMSSVLYILFGPERLQRNPLDLFPRWMRWATSLVPLYVFAVVFLTADHANHPIVRTRIISAISVMVALAAGGVYRALAWRPTAVVREGDIVWNISTAIAARDFSGPRYPSPPPGANRSCP